MLGICVDKLPHSCGTSKGLQVFMQEDGSVDGYCFACDDIVEDPYGDKPVPKFKPKTGEQIQEEVDAIKEYPVVAIPSRGLRRESLSYFGVRTELDQVHGEEPTSVCFPYAEPGVLVGWKIRSLTNKKRQYCVGSVKKAKPFGWARAIQSGERRLIITEGEFDAIAMFQVLKDANRGTAWEENNPAVISIRNGAGGAKSELAKVAQEINKRFDEVVLAFDMDEPGQKAADEVCKSQPTWKKAELPCKDANECLMEGASKALKASVIFKAAQAKNSRIVRAGDLREASRVPAEWGLSTPWKGLTDLTRGIRRGETWYWGAGVKMGKSEIVNALAAHMIKEHGLPVFAAKPEESLNKSYKLLAGKVVGKIFHDPLIPFDEEAYDRAADIIDDLAFFTDVYQYLSWDNLKQDIIYMREVYGVQDAIIDPITCFTNSMTASAANEFLTSMSADASVIAKDYDMTIHLFCHLKAPEGLPHEAGAEVFSTQFAGSRAMMRTCNYMIGIEGDKRSEIRKKDGSVIERSEIERNTRRIKLLEDREFGCTGAIDLYWDKNTSLFTEM